MPIFEVAVLEIPTKKEREDGASEKLVFGPKALVARDSQSAAVAAVAGNGALGDPSRLEVLVRPFS